MVRQALARVPELLRRVIQGLKGFLQLDCLAQVEVAGAALMAR